MVVSDHPATPQLDKALAVRDTSEQIGEFVMEHLTEQGIVLARWMWDQRPCTKTWGQNAGGTYVEVSPLSYCPRGSRVRYDEVDIDIFDCPCPLPSPEAGKPPHIYKHAHWSLIQLDRSESWINDELARFFGLDPVEMETERSRLLESVR